MVHDELAATEPPQVSVSANDGPLAAIVKLTAAAWLFLTVKVVAVMSTAVTSIVSAPMVIVSFTVNGEFTVIFVCDALMLVASLPVHL